MYTIRPFNNSEADFEASTHVFNSMYPEYAQPVAQSKYDDENRSKDYFYLREMIEKDGKVIAVGRVNQSPWSFHPQKYDWGVFVHPDYDATDISQYHFDHIMKTTLADKDVIAMKSSAREDEAWRLQFLKDNGFTFKMRYPHSQLDVNAFDASPFESKVKRFKDSEIEIIDSVELKRREPENWQRILHGLCRVLDADIPNPDSIEEEPLELFVKGELEHPTFMPEGWLVALDGGDYIGITMLRKDSMNPKKLWTGLTGTLRSHRRKGIATVLKLHAIDIAKRYGASVIETDNEENNPMFQINLQLGFEAIPAWMDFEKTI